MWGLCSAIDSLSSWRGERTEREEMSKKYTHFSRKKETRFDILSYPHLVLLQTESVVVDGWRRQLRDEGFGLPQPWLQFLVGLPEASDQNLGLLQSREALTVALAHCIVTITERICLHLNEKKDERYLSCCTFHTEPVRYASRPSLSKCLMFCPFLLTLHNNSRSVRPSGCRCRFPGCRLWC